MLNPARKLGPALLFVPALALAQGKATIGIDQIEFRGMDSTENKVLGIQGDTAGFVDMVATALVKTGKFDVVERDRVDTIVAEQAGIARGSSQPNFNFRGADAVDYVLTGSITEYGIKEQGVDMGRFGGTSMSSQTARMAVDIRVLDVSTGQIGFAETVSAEVSSSGGLGVGGFSSAQATSEGEFLGQVMRKTAQGVVNLMVSNIFPVTIIQVGPDGTAYLNYGDSVLAVGDMLNIYERSGPDLVDPATGLSLGGPERLVGSIQVTDTNPNYSMGVPVTEGLALSAGMTAKISNQLEGAAKPQRKKRGVRLPGFGRKKDKAEG